MADSAGLPARFASAAGRFGKGYLTLAQREARRDLRRILAAVVGLCVAALFVFFAAAACELCVGLLLVERGATPLESATTLATANLVIAVLATWRARVLLARPMLRESRELLVDTWEALLA